jgi:hypothetical protein
VPGQPMPDMSALRTIQPDRLGHKPIIGEIACHCKPSGIWRDVWGARQISSRAHPCRINAAFRLPSERRINAAAKNCVVRPDV